MRGLILGKDHNSYIEMVEKNNAKLKLIAQGDGTEVMVEEINSDKTFGVGPADFPETMEFFYILEGSIIYELENRKVQLTRGEFFYVHHLTEQTIFKTLEPTKLLYLSTRPVFHYLSNNMKELSKIVARVEEKDVYTHNHGKRVEDYSAEIGKRLGFSGERVRKLCYASLFHDIGKIHVPDGVLNKPGRLTDEEYDIIKKHPVDGRAMVQGTYLENIGEIIVQHHERIDGSGYPAGLKDEDILLEARIIGLIDSFDAMISDRPYRKGMSSEVVMEELKELAGIKYDPRVVELFEEIIREEEERDELPF